MAGWKIHTRTIPTRVPDPCGFDNPRQSLCIIVIFGKTAATSQSSNDVLAILYLLCITERILYLIDDISIKMFQIHGYKLISECYNVVTGS